MPDGEPVVEPLDTYRTLRDCREGFGLHSGVSLASRLWHRQMSADDAVAAGAQWQLAMCVFDDMNRSAVEATWST